ncbi:MAG: hypothetical protein ACI9VR_005341 [Cognaticolwellia sp.]|jgi:hypothetical protein
MPSIALPASFVVLCLVMLCFWALSLRKVGAPAAAPIVVGATLALVTAGLASRGVFMVFDPFPRALPVFLFGIVAVFVWGFNGQGRQLTRLPIAWLIGFQSFRILVELAIHEAVAQGIAPPQMTWTGMNWDVLVGLSAIPVALLSSQLPKWALLVWNGLSLGLLLNVVIVAALSMPTPFQQITPDNVWIGAFPYIWLPQVLVTSALLGHVLLFLKLLRPLPEGEAGSKKAG